MKIGEPLPVACTLSDDDLSVRRQEWKALLEGATSAGIPNGVRVTLPSNDRSLRELERLVALEQSCCAWATWAVARSKTELTLEATAPTAMGTAVLHDWFLARP